MDRRAKEILEFWFGGTDDLAGHVGEDARRSRWFSKDDAFDALIRVRFGETHLAAARGELADWEGDPQACTALVVALDQFPRNMYRGTPHMFATDFLARNVTRRAIASGVDRAAPLSYRTFMYMPLMHSELLEDHALAREKFAELVEDCRNRQPDHAGIFEDVLEYEEKHAAIVERFGCYPHRHAVIGRPISAEERAFLEGPDSSF